MDNEIKHLFKIPQYPYDGDTFAICIIPNEEGNYEVRKETSYAINNIQNEDSKTCVFYNNHLFKPNSIIRLVLPGQCSNRIEQYFTYVAVIDTWICYWQILPEMNNVNVYIRYFKYVNDYIYEQPHNVEPDVNDVVLKTLIPVYETYYNQSYYHEWVCPILYIGYEKYSVPSNTIFKYETSIREVLSKLDIESVPIDYNGHINCAGEYYTSLMYNEILKKLYTNIHTDSNEMVHSTESLTPLVRCEINYNDNVMESDRKKYNNVNVHRYLTKKTYYKEEDVTYWNPIQVNSDEGVNIRNFVNIITDETLGILNFITSFEYACKYEDYFNNVEIHHDPRIVYIRQPSGFNNTFEDYYNKPITHSNNMYSFSASSARVYYTNFSAYVKDNNFFYKHYYTMYVDAYHFRYFSWNIRTSVQVDPFEFVSAVIENKNSIIENLIIPDLSRSNYSSRAGNPLFKLSMKKDMTLDEKYNYFISDYENTFTIGSQTPVEINVNRIGPIQVSSSSINNNSPFIFLSDNIMEHHYIAAMIPYKKAIGMHETSKYEDIIYPHEKDGIIFPFFGLGSINPEGLKEILLNGPKSFKSKKNKAAYSGRLYYETMDVYMHYNIEESFQYDPTNTFVYPNELWEVTRLLNAMYSWDKIGHITQYYNGDVISDTYYDYPIKDVNFMFYDETQEDNVNLINVDMEDVCEYVTVLTKIDDDWYSKYDISCLLNYSKLDVPHTFRMNIILHNHKACSTNLGNCNDYVDPAYMDKLFSWSVRGSNNALTRFNRDYTNYVDLIYNEHKEEEDGYPEEGYNSFKKPNGYDYYYHSPYYYYGDIIGFFEEVADRYYTLADKALRSKELYKRITEYKLAQEIPKGDYIENTFISIHETTDLEEIKEKYRLSAKIYENVSGNKLIYRDGAIPIKKINRIDLNEAGDDEFPGLSSGNYLYPDSILYRWGDPSKNTFRKIYVNGLKPPVDVFEESFIIKSFSDNPYDLDYINNYNYLTQILHNPLTQNICLTNFNKVEEKMKNIMNEKNIKFIINVESSDVYVDIIYYDECHVDV